MVHEVDIDALLQEILRQYKLPWYGLHGLSHWGRVLENGLRLARRTGARTKVVTLFAFLHDACRLGEGTDPGHGARGAELAASLRGVFFDLDDRDFRLLYTACASHTDGLTEGDVTVQTCWDADRLDLGRAGIQPRPDRLCTDAAKAPEILLWARERAGADAVPDVVLRTWSAARQGLLRET